ncbi:MAG: MmgE/PrpD family protein [Betaproteobacteria bacterium]|nr:MmgE/PrpD family protein [Betaproteobacteria bacterium]
MEGPQTRQLAEHIAGSKFSDLPKSVVQFAKLLVLDTLGVGIYGTTLPWSERLRATAQAMEAPGDVAVWCAPLALSAPTAAMVNATAVHAFELDDVGPGGHNGSVTLSSALAMAPHLAKQGRKLSGADLINAIVLGVETAARVGNCVGRVPHEGLGFHGPGLFGTFASVASASSALGLSADQLVHALGHAGQQAASLMFTHHGGMGKRLLAGQAARAGTFAALLAQNGFTNAPNVFEAEYGGFCAAHTGNQRPATYDLDQITLDWGRNYHTEKIRFKMWATRAPNHGSLEAIRHLRKGRPIPVEQVKQLRIRLGKGYLQNVAWAYTPTTITSAQLNLYFVAAIMLLENDVFTGQFTEQKIRDPKVLDVIKRISITRDAALDGKGYVEGNPVEIELTDGTVLSAWGKARGDADNPVHMNDVVEKFYKLVAGRIAPDKQKKMVELCEQLDTIPDVSVLIDLLRT